MSTDPQRGYRFANAAQWGACLFAGADPASLSAHDTVRPFLPFATAARRIASQGAQAPAVATTGEVSWHDDATDRLYRLGPGDDTADRLRAPAAIAGATRLLATHRGLWAFGAGRVQRFETDTLARLASIDLDDWHAADIAAACEGIYVLAEREGHWHALHIDCAGRIGRDIEFADVPHATAFVFLRSRKRFVLLTDGGDAQLRWYGETGGAALVRKSVAAMHHCVSATALGSDGRDRAFVAGIDAAHQGGDANVFGFDGDGNALGVVRVDPRDAPATGVAASRDALYVTGPRGLLVFAAQSSVPDDAGDVQSLLLTPALHSPDREDGRRWLRIEATANLPRGTTLELSYASTGDPAIHDRLAKVAADTGLTTAQRIQRLRGERGIWHAPLVFHGESDDDASRFAAPLSDLRDPFLWVCVRVIAAPGARGLPGLSALSVLYPGNTLMEYLPSIYQREEAVSGSFLRALVGVFETTTQDLDARIAALGSHVHPKTAPSEWLDAIARWLGLPWDDTLAVAQKRCIVSNADALAKARGTRAGLETFLACLMPGTPRRFRVVDGIADFGFATVGGSGCPGSTLPAMLGGRPRWHTELDAGARLGRMRLPCDGDGGDPWQLAPAVRLDIAATAEERRAWAPWLSTAIDALVPVTTRARVRWVDAHGLQGQRLDAALVLAGTPTPHLGDDAIIGVARLPAGGTRLGATGADIGTRLL
jgi:phage tail-like protein